MAGPFKILHHHRTPRVDAEGRPRIPQPEKPVHNPCRGCPARCCYQQVQVSLPEVLRMADALDLPLGELAEPVAHSGPHAFRLDADDTRTSAWRPPQGTAGLALRRKDDGGCLFLIKTETFERCGAYELRPSPCRLYPIGFEWGDYRSAPGQVLCPVPYAVTDAAAEAVQSVAKQAVDDWAVHDHIAASWSNRADQSATLQAFWTHALDQLGVIDEPRRTRRLDRLEPGTGLFQILMEARR